MRRAFLGVLAGTLALLWVACDSQPPTQPVDFEPAYDISDAMHEGGLSGFYWLPPMVSQPTTTGTFIGTLSPEAKICEWGGSACIAGGWARVFTMAAGPAGHRVGVDVHGQHYHLNWDTKAFEEPLEEAYYRVSVYLGGREIGYADVYLGVNGATFENLDDDVIGLIDGRTLPIKFRIEYGILEEFNFDIVYHSFTGDDPLHPYASDVLLFEIGSGASVNLTNSPDTIDGTPSWSPDGMSIAFASDRDNVGGEPDIYVMDLVGGTVGRLTTGGGWKPEYSPDGTKIAFQRGWPPEPPPGSGEYSPEGREHDIWIMDAGGGNEIQLTDRSHFTYPWDPYEDHGPTWHPTNPWVTFARSHNATSAEDLCSSRQLPPGAPLGSYDFCDFDIVSVDVSDLSDPDALPWIRHTPRPDRDHTRPRWSPDLNLVFTLQYDETPFMLNAWAQPGPPPVWLLAEDPGGVGNPSWSSAGKVLFEKGHGLFLVDDWAAWKTGCVAPPGCTTWGSLLIGDAAYGRFRPN
jgi:hypothetical protein